jgi:hypothetical protein
LKPFYPSRETVLPFKFNLYRYIVVTVALYTFIYCATLTAYIAEGAKLVVGALSV